MPKPLPPLPPKIDDYHREHNLTVQQVARELDFSNGGYYDWLQSGHTKLISYIEIAKAGKVTLKELYRIISSGEGPGFMAKVRQNLQVVDNAGVCRALGICRTVPEQISKNMCEGKSLEKAHRIANYYNLEIEDVIERSRAAS